MINRLLFIKVIFCSSNSLFCTASIQKQRVWIVYIRLALGCLVDNLFHYRQLFYIFPTFSLYYQLKQPWSSPIAFHNIDQRLSIVGDVLCRNYISCPHNSALTTRKSWAKEWIPQQISVEVLEASQEDAKSRPDLAWRESSGGGLEWAKICPSLRPSSLPFVKSSIDPEHM